jgi:hypothetical protein
MAFPLATLVSRRFVKIGGIEYVSVSCPAPATDCTGLASNLWLDLKWTVEPRKSDQLLILQMLTGQHAYRVHIHRALDRPLRSFVDLGPKSQRADRGAGVDRPDPAGMAGPPGLEEVEGLGAAHVADRNAIGPAPQRRAHQIGQRRDALLGAQRDEVRRIA